MDNIFNIHGLLESLGDIILHYGHRPAAVTGHSALPHTTPPASCGKLVLKKYFPKLIPQLEIPYYT